jgi:hypothetical protein
MTRDEAYAKAQERWPDVGDVDENHSYGGSAYIVGFHQREIALFVALGSGPSYEAAFEIADDYLLRVARRKKSETPRSNVANRESSATVLAPVAEYQDTMGCEA